MNQSIAVLLGALIGGLVGLLGSYLTSSRQAKLERERWRQARADSLTGEVAKALGELTTVLASLSHSMMWATYRALKTNYVPPRALEAFESELHLGVAEAVSAQMRVATLDRQLYERITPRVSLIIRLAGDTFDVLVAAGADVSAYREGLQNQNRQALDFVKAVPGDFAELLRSGRSLEALRSETSKSDRGVVIPDAAFLPWA